MFDDPLQAKIQVIGPFEANDPRKITELAHAVLERLRRPGVGIYNFNQFDEQVLLYRLKQLIYVKLSAKSGGRPQQAPENESFLLTLKAGVAADGDNLETLVKKIDGLCDAAVAAIPVGKAIRHL